MNKKELAAEVLEKISNTMPIQDKLGLKCSLRDIMKYQEQVIEKALIKAYNAGHNERHKEQVIEKLAAYIHDKLWSDWVEYFLFQLSALNPKGSVTIKKADVDRLTSKMNTEYFSLPDKDKEQNRKAAMGILEVIGMFRE